MLKVNSEFKLPKEVFGQEINLKLLAHVVHVYRERSHIGLRHTQTRSEVNRTTKKLYKQKGTGGARHGSRRANVFVGGGVVFGPRPLRRVLELGQKIKSEAKMAAFSAKAKAKEIVVVSGIERIAKTKEVAAFLKKEKIGRVSFVLADKSLIAQKYLRNLKNTDIYLYKNINAFQILNSGTLIIDEEVFEKKIEKVAKKEDKKAVKSSKK